MMQAAYIFVCPEADSKKHRATVEIPTLSMTVVGVKDFDDAVNTAKSLVEGGVQLIELCGGYGAVGTAKIIEAVGDKAAVGAAYYGEESMAKLLALMEE